MKQRLTVLVLLVTGVVASARGQNPDSVAKRQAPPASDSIFIRARQLVVEGNGIAGRALIDSVVAATPDTSPSYPSVLYWRASLAATAAGAERDYRRIIVDFPMSPRSGDALLALAQLEAARGDRSPAAEHLQRFLLEYPQHADRWRAGVTLGRLLLEDGRTARGCAVLLRTRSAMPADAVELRNQLGFYAQRCVGVDTVEAVAAAPPPARADSNKTPAAARRDSSKAPAAIDSARATARRDSARAQVKADTARPTLKADSARRTPRADSARTPRVATATPVDSSAKRAAPVDSSEAVKTRAPSARTSGTTVTQYSIQVAAYATKLQADRLTATLRKRGLSARTVGAKKPFRVRVGRYASKAAASDAERSLVRMGITGFVTTAEPENR